MALLVDTLLDRAIVRADAIMNFENRRPEGTTVDAFMKYRNQVVPVDTIEALKVSKRRPVEIPVLKKYNARIGTVRQINPTPDVITSAFMPLSWQTKEFSFAVAPAINADNQISQVEQFAAQISNSMRSVYFTDANSIEKQLVTYLNANAWGTPPASGVPGVTVASGAYVLDPEKYILQAPVLMRELNINGPYQDISNIASVARQRAIQSQGMYNNVNLAQYAKDMEYYHSNNIAVDATYEETHFIAPAGSLALLSISEFDARNQTPHDTGRYTTYIDPWFGLQWGVRIVSTPTDLSGTYGAGFERVVVDRYDFAIDIAAVSSYSSTAGTSPIVQVNTVTPTP